MEVPKLHRLGTPVHLDQFKRIFGIGNGVFITLCLFHLSNSAGFIQVTKTIRLK